MSNQAKDMQIGCTFNSAVYGEYEVLEYINHNNVRIKFKNTGYECSSRSDRVRSGSVYDRMQNPNGKPYFIGSGKYKSRVNGVKTVAYERWRKMIDRCFSESYKNKFPTYKDVTVCVHWLNFQNFAEWHEANYPRDGKSYNLDKDILVSGNKIYSPETCMYVTPKQNAIQAAKTRKAFDPESHPTAKLWKFIDPDGEIVEFRNLNEFCRVNGLSSDKMRQVHKNAYGYKSHKGYKSIS